MKRNKGGRGNRNPYRTVAVRLPQPLAAWAKRCADLWNEDREKGHTLGSAPVAPTYIPTGLKASADSEELEEALRLCDELLAQASGKENSPRWKKAIQLARKIKGLTDR